MGKLTKRQTAQHREACALLGKDTLTNEEVTYIFNNWHEGADNNQTDLGAYFTPPDLASDLTIEARGDTILDLCAGIGVLSYASYHWVMAEVAARNARSLVSRQTRPSLRSAAKYCPRPHGSAPTSSRSI